MKPSKALGPFGCVPRKPDPAWDHVSWAARAIGMQIFALVDDFATMEVPTHGDPLTSLCKTLSIDGHERRYVKPAIRQLLEMGLLTLGKGCVIVHVRPAKRSTSERELVDFHTRSEREPGAIPTSKVNKVLGIVQFTSSRSEENRSEERESRTAFEGARFEKPPVGECPAELAELEPTPKTEWAKYRCWYIEQFNSWVELTQTPLAQLMGPDFAPHSVEFESLAKKHGAEVAAIESTSGENIPLEASFKAACRSFFDSQKGRARKSFGLRFFVADWQDHWLAAVETNIRVAS